MFSKTILVLTALATATSVVADHTFNVYNYCGQTKRAHVKSASFNHVSGLLATNGGRYSVTVPENAKSMIVFGEGGECSGADGPGCTRLECSFDVAGFKQCNLSRVAGWNIPMAYSWGDGGCTGGHCPSPSSGPADCWVAGIDDGRSIRQCNTPNVALNVYLCGA